MQLIKELIIIDKASRIPVYLQISQSIIQCIRQGKLSKGPSVTRRKANSGSIKDQQAHSCSGI